MRYSTDIGVTAREGQRDVRPARDRTWSTSSWHMRLMPSGTWCTSGSSARPKNSACRMPGVNTTDPLASLCFRFVAHASASMYTMYLPSRRSVSRLRGRRTFVLAWFVRRAPRKLPNVKAWQVRVPGSQHCSQIRELSKQMMLPRSQYHVHKFLKYVLVMEPAHRV